MPPSPAIPYYPPLPVTPPAVPHYCPRCENEVKLMGDHHHDIYDCKICEAMLFESEVDSYPGETKGKKNAAVCATKSE